MSHASCQEHRFEIGLKGTFFNKVLLEDFYRSIEVSSAKMFYEDRPTNHKAQ